MKKEKNESTSLFGRAKTRPETFPSSARFLFANVTFNVTNTAGDRSPPRTGEAEERLPKATPICE